MIKPKKYQHKINLNNSVRSAENLLERIFAMSVLLFVFFNINAKDVNETAPTASFTFTGETCANGTISFNNTSTPSGSPISFTIWDFGDGGSSTSISPSHVYTIAGSYTVKLTIQDELGNIDQTVQSVVITPIPQVDFIFSASDQCVSTTQSFTNLSSIPSNDLTYEWDFGDGSGVSTLVNPTYNYSMSGIYFVSLTATSLSTGCDHTISQELVINPDPISGFFFQNECDGKAASFTNTSSVSLGNLSYAWTFGDGKISTLENPSNLYDADGDYNVQLTVTTDKGCKNALLSTITIHEQPQADFTLSNVCIGGSSSFTNTSILATSYHWDFGDGFISTNKDPTHTYRYPGIYEVVLTASNIEGCMDVASSYLEVFPNPTASFTVENTCLGNPTLFSNTSAISSGSLSYSWDFGDGNNSILDNPSHIYTAAGTYTVALTATSGNTCVDVFSYPVEISAPSDGGIVQGGTTLCEGDPTIYQLDLVGNIGSILRWESSTTGIDQWATINSNDTILNYSSLPRTTFFRAIVKNGNCNEAISSIGQVTLETKPNGGLLSGSTSVCFGDNSGRLELTDKIGIVEEWLSSTTSENGPWISFGNTSDFLDYTNLSETTFYRVVLSNGTCANDTSSVAKVEVMPITDPGVLSANATVCAGSNSGTLTLSGFVGDIVLWEFASNQNGPWSIINIQENTLDYHDLVATSYFRARVQSGSCAYAVSNQAVITVDDPSLAGSISGNSSLCQSDAATHLMLHDFRGSILRWQSSKDSITWGDITVSVPQLTVNNLTDTTYYRAEVQNGSCSSVFTLPYQVAVNSNPNATFMVDDVCFGSANSFINASSIVGNQTMDFIWDFSDGSSSSLKNPTHTFGTPGNYPVKLIVTSSEGCVDSVTNTVVVNTPPSVFFSQDDVCLGQVMAFVNQSTPDEVSVQSYNWDFGDGNNSTQKSPSHMYSAAGNYEVTLRVVTNEGCTGLYAKEVVVEALPSVSFSFENVCFGESIDFTNKSSIPSGNLNYLWNFGDGQTSTDINPSHLYSSEGTYLVNLSVRTVGGCTLDETQSVVVYNQPMAKFSVSDQCLDSLVTFENHSSGIGLTNSWNFGDGFFSNEPNPIHQYSVPSLYTINLSIVSEAGCADTYTKPVRVHPIPVVNFSTQNVCDSLTTEFSNFSTISSGEISYTWDFGDGTSSSQSAPKHKYDGPSTYNVVLTAISDMGCVSRGEKATVVHPSPEADFWVEESCDGSPFTFQNTSTISSGNITSYLWEFGDETSSLVPNPTKLYLNDGTYQVSLNVKSNFDCEDRVTKQVRSYEMPIADFEVESVCFGTSIDPINESFIQEGSLRYYWDFGDGNTSEVTNPSHIYEESGIYTISLTAISSNNCTDMISKDVQVYDLPLVSISADTTVSQGFPVQLLAQGGVYYQWSPLDGLSNSNIANPVATPLEGITYTVQVTDQRGCQNTNDVNITVVNDFKLIASNILTPDDNGQNDYWVIKNVETFGSVNVRVYDRFGKLVFQDEEYQNDWSGTAGNDLLPDGTYYYFITFRESPKQYTGAVTIIRNR